MSNMKVKEFFEKHPIFRYEEFAEYMQSVGTSRPKSWRQQLNYHLKVGHLARIRKYLYAVKPIFSQDIFVDPYIIASIATRDAIIAYHSALELHGVAYTTFSELIILTSYTFQPFNYEGLHFRAIKKPERFVDVNNPINGIEIIKRAGMELKVTNLEKTIVDILDRVNLGGGWEEICRSLDNVSRLDTNKVVQYALALKNATTIAKVGFFIEQLPKHLSIDKSNIEKLLPHIPKQPHYINRDDRKGGKYVEKWRLIVPISIINRSWEEPNVPNI